MIQHVNLKGFRLFFSVLIVFMMIVGALPSMANAAEKDLESEAFIITGNFNETFRLNSNKESLFSLKNAAPGDSWSGSIELRNETEEQMVLSLLSIENMLTDRTLFDALSLELYNDGEELYSGSYGVKDPLIENIEIPSGEAFILDATVTLPIYAGNEVQNKKMESEWVFEVDSYYEPAPSIDNVGSDSDVEQKPGFDSNSGDEHEPGSESDLDAEHKPGSDSDLNAEDKPGSDYHGGSDNQVPKPVQTGLDLITDTILDASFLWIILFALLGIVITGIRIYFAKKAAERTEGSVGGYEEKES